MSSHDKIVADWGCDALLERMSSEIPSIDVIKLRIADAIEKGKNEIQLWSAKEAFFKPHSSIEGSSCKSEKFRNTDMTVEEAAIAEGAHSVVLLQDGSSLKLDDILSSPDFLPLRASSYGENVSCSHAVVQCGDETEYWVPKEHQIFLIIWPDTLPADMIESRKIALANHKERFFTLQVGWCFMCKAKLFAFNLFVLNSTRGDIPFCSLECITNWQNGLD